MRRRLRPCLALLLAALGCAAPGPPRATTASDARVGAAERSLLELAREMTAGLAYDPHVVAAARHASRDDPRAVVRLEAFDDFTDLPVELDSLREGLERHLLGTGRFRFVEGGGRGEVDFLLSGWLAPEEGRAGDEVLLFVLRAVTPDRQDEVWIRELRLRPGQRPGTFVRS